jgi:hypothetical protein
MAEAAVQIPTDIKQLFIPGLHDADRRLSAAGRAGMHFGDP